MGRSQALVEYPWSSWRLEKRYRNIFRSFVETTVHASSVQTLGKRLTDEIMHVITVESEDIINFRPLTYVSLEPVEAEALTLNHFLRVTGKPVVCQSGGALRDAFQRSQQSIGRAGSVELWKSSLYLTTHGRVH